MWSSSSRARFARDVDALIAAEWALEELDSPPAPPAELPAEPEPEDTGWLEEQRRLEEARERERIAEEAFARGYEEGLHAGEIAEAARLRNALAAAEQALDEIRAGELRWTGAIEENICALAVAVARHIVGRELQQDPAGVGELVRQALAEFPIDQPIRVRVNPQDLAALESISGEGAATAITRDRDARWVPDPRLAPGGCVVEGRDRIVDGRVDTGLERVYRRLTYNHA